MTAALYSIAAGSDRAPCFDLNDAYWQAWALLQSGVPVVDILRHKLTADCWGPATGRDELLHHLAPAEHPIAPTGGHGSTATFPPYVWRMLTEPPPASPPVVIEERQGTLW